MAGVHHTLIQLLILKLLNTGVFGESSSTYMYNILGDDVNMPCKNLVYPVNCNSVGWIHLKTGSRNAFQEVSEGKVRVESNRAERLTVKPDCSLTVHNVTSEDVGKYRCQTGNIDSLTHLSLLTISSSTPESDLKPDYPLTLRCTLHTPLGPGMCRYGELDKISLGWVDQTGADLQDVSRYHFTVHSTCDITLEVTLQREDINRRWTCQLTDKGKVKTYIYFHSTLSGVFGESSSTYTYNILGDDVNMPCKNLVYPVNCSSVGWIFAKIGLLNAIQEVSEGKVRVDSNRAERLTVKPDCSLTVHNVTSEDVGKYRCQTGNIDSLTHLSLLTSEYF
ncbi:uncharacterized protein LOC117593282 isoform X1 [Esox lucius]|uniref:uncharacterized protein LOC117593282 isoform X1 n=2 Tax=Esox lucius TaxID=8010 RepID=UPI001476CDF3|nr:uncharacterized protein LOC117593282 isoform X1 [Esox lucius]